MLDNQPAMEMPFVQSVTVPRHSRQKRRSASWATNRPERNSRPLQRTFYGAFAMPDCEHLIPFLN